MHISELNHYIVYLDFKFQKLYIIWVLDEFERVVVDDQNHVLAFKTQNELIKFAHENGLRLVNDDVSGIDINYLQQWIIIPGNKIDCKAFLDFWNLCTDISESLKITFAGDVKGEVRDRIYDKLFDIAGPFIMLEPHMRWEEDEINKLNEIMQNGLALLIDNLFIVN